MEQMKQDALYKVEEQLAVKSKHEQLEKERIHLVSKIEELYQDVMEHKLVLEALESMPPDRRCYRMVGEVLVERTIGEVRPALEEHKSMVEKIIADCQKQLEEKNEEIKKFIKEIQTSQLKSKITNNKNALDDKKNLDDKSEKREVL